MANYINSPSYSSFSSLIEQLNSILSLNLDGSKVYLNFESTFSHNKEQLLELKGINRVTYELVFGYPARPLWKAMLNPNMELGSR